MCSDADSKFSYSWRKQEVTATKRNHLDRNQLKKDMLHNGPLKSDLVLNIYIYISMWAIFFKVFAKFVETLLLLYVLFFGCQACGIIAP